MQQALSNDGHKKKRNDPSNKLKKGFYNFFPLLLTNEFFFNCVWHRNSYLSLGQLTLKFFLIFIKVVFPRNWYIYQFLKYWLWIEFTHWCNFCQIRIDNKKHQKVSQNLAAYHLFVTGLEHKCYYPQTTGWLNLLKSPFSGAC